MRQPFTKLLLLFFATIICVLTSVTAAAPQNEEILGREQDEGATTSEERQHALAALLEAANQSREDGQLSNAIRFMNRAGRLQLRLNLPQDALTTYQKALSLKQSSDPQSTVDSLLGLGHAYNHLSRCNEAQLVLQEALTLSEQSNYVAGKAEALLTVSHCQNYSDHALALRTAQEALGLWQSVGSRRDIAESHSVIGQYQLMQNNLTEATQSYEAALYLWRELNLRRNEAQALINLGFIEYRKGAWQGVLAYLTQAQELLDEKAEPYMMGQITAGLAEAFIECGMPETGLTKYQEALGYYHQTQNPRAVLVIVCGIGRTHYLLGNFPEAIANLEDALRRAGAINETTVAAMSNESLGSTYYAMHDYATALHHYENALNLYTKTSNIMEAGRVRALMGQVYQQQGKFAQAKHSYLTALETFHAISDRVNESATLYALGSLELSQNDLEAAEAHLRQSIDVTENMRRVSTSGDLATAFSATVHDRYETYIECLMRQHEARPNNALVTRAFEINEQARGRTLSELLRATQTNTTQGLDPQLANREKSLRQTLRLKEDAKVALLARVYKKEELNSLEVEVSQLEFEYKKVNDEISARYPSYQQLNRPAGWSLQNIQEQVLGDDDTILLEYSLGPNKSYVWAVTRNSITSHELPPSKQILESAQQAHKLLSTAPNSETAAEVDAVLNKLGDLLLSRVASQLTRRRVIVVADGALNYVPFQALPVPTAGDQPLLATHEVINAPSASILGQLRQEVALRDPPDKLLAAFGDPVFSSDYDQRKNADGGLDVASLQTLDNSRWHHALRDIELNGDSFDPSVIKPLFYAKLELANLRKVVSSSDAFVATDFAASRENLLNADLGHYAVLHFATHGLLDPKRPENSGLVLSTVNSKGQTQNGFVGLEDIYGLRAPVNLVVLSACQTALGKNVRGEGLIGLTRGFMYAGASSVVASLWKVDDEATAELMKRFYANMLQRGMTPSEALRAAQISIRDEPNWHSPYYWAAFTLQGEYRHVITPPSRFPNRYVKFVAVGLVLVLSAFVAWIFWRRRGERNEPTPL